MRMGVVADDVTGSNDIGIMFAKSGCLTHIYSYSDASGLIPPTDIPDIFILDTNSRLDAGEVAYRKVFAATKALESLGCRQFFNKTCSVFRGNIGVEFDAMLDALGLEFAVVVLGFPKNGRTTINGIHYVHGKRLEESEFRNDPIHPMTRSNLVEILQSQTQRKVSLVSHEVVSRGAKILRWQIHAMRARCQYLILDVVDQTALATIAAAVFDEPVLCGSSALAEELPPVWGVPPVQPTVLDIPRLDHLGILIAAGSLMPQTSAQIEYLHNKGTPLFVLNTVNLFDLDGRSAEINRLVEAITDLMHDGRDVLFHSPNDPAMVEITRQNGYAHGLTKTEVSRIVSEAIAEVTALALDHSGQNRLVVAGGETSAAICERLDVRGMRVWKEIQPGLPSCVSLSKPPRLLVLKSGSFGKSDFFEKVLQHLREQ